ncbi:MAG: hypothetical protein EAX96_00625 [Candidatus Lokiarchaeota archaeon]|nr:hypothetical protein [Candidatus Lokiarchaeota archaeon]
MTVNLELEKLDEGYKKIFNEVIQKFNKEAEDIILEGYKKAKKIKDDAKAEIENEVERILNKAKKIESGKKNKIISSLEIDLRRNTLLKKNEIIEDILNQVIERLKEFSKNNPRYKHYLLHFIEQAIDTVLKVKLAQIETKRTEVIKFCEAMNLNQENIVKEDFGILIYINENDKKYLTDKEINEYKNKYYKNIKIEIDNNIIGGARIVTSDNSILFENTLKNRLEQRKTDIIRKISDILWG